MSAATTWSEPGRTVAFIKGRVALHALLRAAGIGPGDDVLVPGFTCVVVPAAILYTGARPVFYDVDTASMNGDLESARRALTPNTRALIVQHTFGAISDPSPWIGFARAHDLVLLEDAAHAMGAFHGDHEAGRIGDGAFTSLQWSKTVTCGLGGIARIESDALRQGFAAIAHEYEEPSAGRQIAVRVLEIVHDQVYDPRWAWTVRDTYRAAVRRGLLPGSSSTSELADVAEPANYRNLFGRMREPSLERAVASLAAVVRHRTAIATHARRRLHDAGFRVQAIEDAARSSHLRVACVVENRTELLEAAERARVELGDWFDAPLHPSSAPQHTFGYEARACPRAEWLCARLVNLPTHTSVSLDEIDRIVDFVVGHAVPAVEDVGRAVSATAL